MGNYAVQADIQEAFNDASELNFLTSDDAAVLDADSITAAIATAEGDIDTRLAQRYETPVVTAVDASIAALLKRQTVKVAKYYLYSRNQIVPTNVQFDYEHAIDWADKIAKGEYRLPGAVTAESTKSRSPLLVWSDSTRELDDDGGRYWTRETTAGL